MGYKRGWGQFWCELGDRKCYCEGNWVFNTFLFCPGLFEAHLNFKLLSATSWGDEKIILIFCESTKTIWNVANRVFDLFKSIFILATL